MKARAHLALSAAYVPLVVWATWPLARDAGTHVADLLPGGIHFLSLADVFFVAWSLAWDTHSLLTRPLALFDANIFHPLRWALARSDHFLGDVPLFAPVYLATGNPILAHNVALLACLALSAVAMYALVWSWTKRAGAAFVAGACYALAPWRLMVPYVQTQVVFYLPILLLAGERVLDGRRGRPALLLAACVFLAALSDLYVGILAGTLVAVFFAVRLVLERPERAAAVRFLGAAAAGAAAALPAYLPQFLLARRGLLAPPSSAIQELVSAWPLRSYLTVRAFAGGTFLCLTLVALAAIGLVVPGRESRTRRTVLLATALVAWVVSLGPTLVVGAWRIPLPFRLALGIPGLGALRGAGRFGILVTLAASGLAGLGTATLAARLPQRAGGALAAVLTAALLVEIGSHPYPLAAIETGVDVPPVYRWLATAPEGPVLELPLGWFDGDFKGPYWQARYALFSTYHWRPLVNGYSGYPPPGSALLMTLARRLPDPAALQDLVDLSGVRWVIVHRALLDADARAPWEGATLPGLELRQRFGDDLVFAVDVPVRHDARAALRAERPGATTLDGTSRAPLPPAARRAAFTHLDAPPTVAAGVAFPLRVAIENQGTATWPGLDPFPGGLVSVHYRWTGPEGGSMGDPIPLAHDVHPGEIFRTAVPVKPPTEPGEHRLTLSIAQDDGPPFTGAEGDVVIQVIPWGPGKGAPGSLFAVSE